MTTKTMTFKEFSDSRVFHEDLRIPLKDHLGTEDSPETKIPGFTYETYYYISLNFWESKNRGHYNLHIERSEYFAFNLKELELKLWNWWREGA